MNPKNKSAVESILGKMAGPKVEVDVASPDADEPDMGLETAMKDLIDAVKAGDAKAAAVAFKAAIECSGDSPASSGTMKAASKYGDEDE